MGTTTTVGASWQALCIIPSWLTCWNCLFLLCMCAVYVCLRAYHAPTTLCHAVSTCLSRHAINVRQQHKRLGGILCWPVFKVNQCDLRLMRASCPGLCSNPRCIALVHCLFAGAEFCPTSHHFVVNGDDRSVDFSSAGTAWGCTQAVAAGSVPNEHG